ncbi:MAG: hypothetical protein WCR72_09670 [Bacteroidota bacterium]
MLIILSLTGIFFIFSMWHRFIYIDDCWHGEESYWLAHEGVVKTKSMQGILGFENKVMVYHKLNVILGAIVIKYIGWSVYYLKLITLFFYASFFYFLHLFVKRFPLQYSKEFFLLTTFFVVVNPLMVLLGFTFRPEILAMFFGFLSYFTLENYLKTSKLNWILASAVFAGLAFFTHLNAMIFGIAGFVLLIANRKYTAAGIYTVCTLLVSMLYTFDLWQGDNFQVFKYQIENWPTLKLGKTYFGNTMLNFFLNKGLNLLNEHQRFFWSDKVAAFSVIFFTSLIFKFKFLWTNYKSLLIYTLALIVSLNLTGSHIAERFMIYYYPFMAMIAALSIISIKNEPKKYFIKAFIALVLVMQLALVVVRFQDIFRQNADYPAIHHALSEQINDPGTKVLAPDRFVFNEIETRPVLSYHVWEYHEDIYNVKLNQLSALKLASDLGAKYIILDEDKLAADDPCFANGIIKPNPYFVILKKYDSYLILKKAD